MQLDSVRDLKQVLNSSVLAPFILGGAVRSFSLSAGPLEDATKPQPSFALGVAQFGPTDYRLAVRIQRRELQTSRELDIIRI